VHIDEQGRGLGGHLLKDAVKRTLVIAEQIGVRAMLTHAAADRAASFYARYGFVASPTDPLHMLLLPKDARKLSDRGGQRVAACLYWRTPRVRKTAVMPIIQAAECRTGPAISRPWP
jgi:N-acetylglutamate synthase-like GNAT family acetyltransferase